MVSFVGTGIGLIFTCHKLLFTVEVTDKDFQSIPFQYCQDNPSPTPPLRGEGLSNSPFPCREGGWGVRFSGLNTLILIVTFLDPGKVKISSQAM
ncbi:MAG TPA: hypothetical protein DEG17_25115 [Cyanobacteria bacterium UBA11149]|nr:hypothetical protein [Cyanobacteria bacterium UBA11166]HBR73271.1 hypothetical protein [Cyanobacteria bacterium UBA11159]HBS67781.1 hypothetical protein [Cyanobacteria bacterium UBA11153]HBW92060.1 hypothetical protein [Cyanobacteria bacterium UBA11149]